jgi:aconitate hydratase
MLNLASRSSQAWRSIQRLAKGMASVSERIGDTKVPMSLLEPGAYINYQRIEDNLAIVRDRYFSCFSSRPFSVSYRVLGSSALSHFRKKFSMATSMTPTIKTLSAVLVT